jgi:hypothetical protein
MKNAGVARFLLGLVAVGVWASGCVRLDPPGRFACKSSAECADSQFCSKGGVCLDFGECQTTQDCGVNELCQDGSCAHCWAGHVDVCNGFACVAGECKTTCTFDSDCQPGLTCSFYVAGVIACISPPKSSGGSCTSSGDCAVGLDCCGQAGAMTCGICFPDGTYCSSASDCSSGNCCPDLSNPALNLKVCRTLPCT